MSFTDMTYKKTWAEFAEAFTIFAKYGDEEYSTQADHEEIFAGPNPTIVSAEDRARLEELGWMECGEEFNCFHIFL